jgi:hypothetical protein
MNNPQNASAPGATLGPRLIAAGTPKDLAEAGTILPRRGRSSNAATRGLVPIAVLSCEAGVQLLGAGPVAPGRLGELLVAPLELLPDQRPVHVLAVEVAGVAAEIQLPADAYTRDEAVEVAWRRIAIVAARMTPAQEG